MARLREARRAFRRLHAECFWFCDPAYIVTERDVPWVVPRAGDKVTIAAGKDVVLDVSPPALNGLTIDGKLSFANTADLELTTEWVMVHGELEIGTEARPHTRKATITLTDNVKGEDIGVPAATVASERVDRGIMLMGGTLDLHGDRKHTWTKLANTANTGSTSIQVLDAAGWRVGDEIVLASTDFDPRQAERRTISAIKGNAITLNAKLDYRHFGKSPSTWMNAAKWAC